MSEEFKRLGFLIGEWKGKASGPVTEGAKDIENRMVLAFDPGQSIISGTFEARQGERVENRGYMYILYDGNKRRYVRKLVYSYGWIQNEEGVFEGNDLVLDVVSTDAEPDYFKGLRVRHHIQKVTDDEIVTRMETAKNDGDYTLYVQQKFRRVR